MGVLGWFKYCDYVFDEGFYIKMYGIICEGVQFLFVDLIERLVKYK